MRAKTIPCAEANLSADRPAPNASIEPDKIYLEDAVVGMRKIPTETVDLIVTDPPFAINFRARKANYNRTAANVLDGYNEIAREDYPEFTRSWMKEAFRTLKKSGSAFVFSGWNNLKDILVAADEVGFVTVNHIIWKYQFGVVCRRRFVTSHYHCLFFCKNDKARKFNLSARFCGADRADNGGSMRYRDMEDVWVIRREYWHRDDKTPTKLPREIIEKIIAYTGEKGDLVLDPFLGSGQVAVVGKSCGLRYIGFEIVPEYHRFATRRLREGVYRIKNNIEKEDSPLLAKSS